MAHHRLNTRAAQAAKFNFLLAAVEGDGDLTSLLAYADWLEEHGAEEGAKNVRIYALRDAADTTRTITGETWLRWHAAYELKIVAEGLVKTETGFRKFAYHGNYNPDGSCEANDGSMEWALRNGYVPTLSRGRMRSVKLGRIIEALGYRVKWVE